MASHTYNHNHNSNSRGTGSSANNYSSNYQERPQFKHPHIHWEAGQLAFLTSCERYNNEDYCNLIKSGEIPPKATNHPCVILQRFQDSDHCLITPVSAFSASVDTGFLPPWKQQCHRRKKAQDFRSFRGSESSSSSSSESDSDNEENCQLLELRNGRTMPKPKASWIYIQHIYVVPVHLLIPFKKPGRGEREPREPRQLTDASLKTLRAHIQQKCTLFQKRITKLNQLRRGSQNSTSSGCSVQDKPQRCSSPASQFHHEIDQTYRAPGLNGTHTQPHSPPQTPTKAGAKANTNANTAAWSKTLTSSSSSSAPSSPTQGPWRKLQPATPLTPTTPKSTPTTPTRKGPNQLQQTPRPPKIANGSRWTDQARYTVA